MDNLIRLKMVKVTGFSKLTLRPIDVRSRSEFKKFFVLILYCLTKTNLFEKVNLSVFTFSLFSCKKIETPITPTEENVCTVKNRPE